MVTLLKKLCFSFLTSIVYNSTPIGWVRGRVVRVSDFGSEG